MQSGGGGRAWRWGYSMGVGAELGGGAEAGLVDCRSEDEGFGYKVKSTRTLRNSGAGWPARHPLCTDG